jgi:hypothetical protein
MQTNVQDLSEGFRRTADGATTEGYAVYLTTAGKVKTIDEDTQIPIGYADSTVADGAEVTVFPFLSVREHWVSVSAATAVGDHMVRTATTGRWAPTTSTGAIVSGIAATSTASSGFAKIIPVAPTIRLA